ncbi:PhnD/SsuA/transferrin family substrate-binding protein [Paracoccus sp. Ld10]|uniref:PhnD/SsuA/transferrin family substrate-binding protein n=1 Tax=Paracoccus sp. Ld10 TaxID=649158 RepID=UPI00386A0043
MTHAPCTRRRAFLAAATLGLAAPHVAFAAAPVRLGVTPVFADGDIDVIGPLQRALETSMSRPVQIVQRRTYQEVTGLLLSGNVDAAWICGFPFLQHQQQLSILAVPLWHAAPTYRSYLIVASDDRARSLSDLRNARHAFSDPDSNSGWLVTASDLARMGTTPDMFFGRTIFTYGHRNVVRAVASGLTRSGSVDGYVWQALSQIEPHLTGRTRVIGRSEPFDFPPFVCRMSDRTDDRVRTLRRAL